jgi:tetratricopeptide (TPR) repeat protein
LLGLLDGLPLAIAQAAAFLHESGYDLKTYIGFYEHQWKELMNSRDWEGAPLQDYPDRSVWTTWAISYNAIRERHVPAANLLLLWAFLDSKDLWYGLFAAAYSASTTTATSLSEWIGDLAINEVEFAKAIQLLRNYSLIEDVEGLGSYATHPVVHRWAYYFQGKDSRVQLAQLAVIIVGWAVPDSSSREYSTIQRRLLPHAQACSRWVLTDETRRSSRSQERVSIEIKVAEERVVMLDAIHLLGNLYADQGKLAEAEQMYQRALHGYEKALGAENTATYIPALNTIWGLGYLFERQADLSKARIMYSKALLGYEKVVGPNHPRSRSLRDNLQALDTATENETLKDVEESVNNSRGETSRLGPERAPSKTKRHKLLKKLGLR